MNIIWRVAGVALAVGLALFLLTLIIKVLLVGAGLFLLARVVGPRLMGGRAFGPLGRGGWQSSTIISIDNPTYRSGVTRASYERVIPIG
ncbi:hypothetical protein [Spirosoma validum]|uniref:Uncharacterized protein n=1 Tax=Spirosoma validum TaxID=2771355 RepID=A0A927B2Y2_9BACT|nr:hypothetical protein [Spirosoma validum]MBD2754440.1 hypothetical protein [Spirosoma validum]